MMNSLSEIMTTMDNLVADVDNLQTTEKDIDQCILINQALSYLKNAFNLLDKAYANEICS